MEGYGDFQVCFQNGSGSSSAPYQQRPWNGHYSSGAVGFDSESTDPHARDYSYERFLAELDLYNKMCNMSVRDEPLKGFSVGNCSLGGGSGSSISSLYKSDNLCGSCKGGNFINGGPSYEGFLGAAPPFGDDSVMYNKLRGSRTSHGADDSMRPLFSQDASINPSSGFFGPYANGMFFSPYNDLQMMQRSHYNRGGKKAVGNIAALTYENGLRKNTEIRTPKHSMLGKSPESAFFSNCPCPSPRSVAEVQGCILPMSMDQDGCRFLQKAVEEGTRRDVQIIFEEIIGNIEELVRNQFASYLVQKLLDACTEEQRMKIVLILTRDPEQMLMTCFDNLGTRVVQKLIGTLRTKEQISSVLSALEPVFLDLVNNLNGNHVIKRCLERFSIDDNKFIFDSASKFCLQIATHQHGCCVLQHCIANSSGKQREKLVSEIISHALILAQDPFGNYVIQYIIDMKLPSAVTKLMARFEGNYVHLSSQKFSSHVVEKCVKELEESGPVIVREILSVPQFEQLLQDPYANYVIHSAITHTKGHIRATLVGAITQHRFLRTSPYCKKIFSNKLLKN